MLSRVAENIYWLARYLERAEDTARLINVTSNLLLDFPRTTRLDWDSLVTISGAEETFDEHYDNRSADNVLNFLCVDERYSGSIFSSLGYARENLRTTRDIMPREIWEELNTLYLDIHKQSGAGMSSRKRDAFMKRVIRSCQSINGVIEGSLSHTQVHTFLMLGRNLERADMTTRIIDVRSANLLPRSPEELTPFESLQWMSVLKSLTGYQMYRQQIRLRVNGPDVLRFLLQDDAFPRAVASCLGQMSFELEDLPGHENAQALVDKLLSQLINADLVALAHEPDVLHDFVDELQIAFNELHQSIADLYFSGRYRGQSQSQVA
ncbi:alpha-E domain-containing protein [Saccharospirillum mangrovi]|uniref:alpha-E domain-containing protein n=1 Tax=Saccharospirillum mangrovi TaxID=2161747 RepID=UPI000D3556D8|nr:alpha-E domain-containing protein [Saccharospirillum mangrovi]